MWANVLTTSRLVLAGGFAAGVAWFARAPGPGLSTTGLAVLLAVAALEEATDLLDGIVARRSGMASKFGGIYDPMADSLARLAVFFSLALAGWISIAVPLVMTGRDVIVSYTRIVQAMTGGKTSARISGKVKAIVQGAAIFVVLVLAWIGMGAFRIGSAVTAGAVILVTLWSLVDYLRGVWPQLRRLDPPGPKA